jgi:hypothetical protein
VSVIGLEFVAGMTTVKKIIKIVCTAETAGLNVVNGQFGTDIKFCRATIGATKAAPFAHQLA